MQRRRQMKQPKSRTRSASAIVASAAAVGALAAFPTAGQASPEAIAVGLGGSSIVVNGTTISTSNLTLAQLARLQGVPAATVKLELDEVAAGTPVAAAVESLVDGLPLETSLASALDQLSSASGGLITPQTALADVVADEGTPGASGANGSSGAAGANGAGAAPGAAPAGSTPAAKANAKKRFTLSAGKRSLKGHPGTRVKVRFNVSSAAKLSYGGGKLGKGSRKVKAGANTITLKLPRKHGNYKLLLSAVSSPEGQRAQTTIALHDAAAKPAKHGK